MRLSLHQVHCSWTQMFLPIVHKFRTISIIHESLQTHIVGSEGGGRCVYVRLCRCVMQVASVSAEQGRLFTQTFEHRHNGIRTLTELSGLWSGEERGKRREGQREKERDTRVVE